MLSIVSLVIILIIIGNLQTLPSHTPHVVNGDKFSSGSDSLDDLLGIGNDEEAAIVLVDLLDFGVVPQRTLVLHLVHYPLRYLDGLAAILHEGQKN